MTTDASKIQQHGIIGLLTAILAVSGWGAVKPDDVDRALSAHGEEIQALREHQSELRFSIKMLAENVRRLTDVIEQGRP